MELREQLNQPCENKAPRLDPEAYHIFTKSVQNSGMDEETLITVQEVEDYEQGRQIEKVFSFKRKELRYLTPFLLERFKGSDFNAVISLLNK